MLIPPAPFDLNEAVLCARLVEAAYDLCQQWEDQGKPSQRSAFAWTPKGPAGVRYLDSVWGQSEVFKFFHKATPFGFVAASEDERAAYVVFRGTQTPLDGLADLRARQEAFTPVPGAGDAHDGFVDIYVTLAEDLRAEVARLPASVEKLYVTGHSMGSAISTLAVPDLVANTRFQAAQLVHYNLASPRVLSADLAAHYEGLGVPTYRVVNTSDLIPEVPPAVFGSDLYQHVGTPVCFTEQKGSITNNHSSSAVYLARLLAALPS